MAEEAKKEEDVQLKCIYGNKVKIQNLRTNDVSEFTLVTFTDEVLNENKISNYTVIGRAIWAKHEGDEVEIALNGAKPDMYRIISIENA